MRRITRNFVLAGAGVAAVVGVFPTGGDGVSMASACRICDIAADAADDIVGGIVPPSLQPYGQIPGEQIRTAGDGACSTGAGGGPVPKEIGAQIQSAKNQACNLG